MRNFNVKLLLNRVKYDPTKDLGEISAYFHVRGVNFTFNKVKTDITGYSVTSVTNPFGNQQNILSGAESLVKPYLSPSDHICALVIQGYKEFDVQCPSESEDKQYISNTKTVFLSANADDNFYDQYPNFKIWLMHELVHALATIAQYEGFNVIDSMDILTLDNGQKLYYFRNYEPEDVNSNFIRTFESFYHTGFLTYN